MSALSRRLDDRIRALCTKVVATSDQEELNVLLPELRSCIRQAVERVRAKAVRVLGSGTAPPNERRKTS